MQNLTNISPQLRANIEAILNPVLSDNYNSVNGVSTNIKITEAPKPISYYIEVTFHNQLKDGLKYTDPNTKEERDYFEFTPIRMNGFRIQQNFTTNYLNHYEINCKLTVDQYQLLFYNYKDLRCNVILYSMDINTGAIYGKTAPGEPILFIENAYCIFKDKVDLLKKNPRGSIIPTEEGMNISHQGQLLDNISFQLIPEEDYLFRIEDCNAIFTKSTVADAIWGIAKVAGCVDAIMLIDPDNKTVYNNLIIPPVLSIPDALEFLQEHYGVYNKGLGFFFQRKALYIYPKFETNPIMPKDKTEQNDWKSEKDSAVLASRSISSTSTVRGEVTLNTLGDGGMVHIYIAGENNYTGMQCYHGFENQTIHIVSNDEATFQDLADTGLENTGYGYVIHHSDRDIDVGRTVLEADDPESAKYGVWPINIHETPNNAYLTQDQQNTQIGITSTKSNLQYMDTKSNPFTIQSALNSYRRSIAIFSWNAAIPFTFRPGYRICCHYDGEDETKRDLSSKTGDSLQYMTRSGVIDEVDYTFTVTKFIGPITNYFCKARVTASLEVEKTKHLESI